MKNLPFFCATIASLLLFSNCKKSDQSTTAGIDYQLQAINSTSTVNRQQGTVLQWTSANAYATLLKFEAKKAGQEIESKSSIAHPVNLLQPVANSLGAITIPAGTYDEVETRIVLNRAASVPSIELTGSAAFSTGTARVHFISYDEVIIKAEQHNVVVNNTNNTAAILVDLAQLTSGITERMLQAAQQVNGSIAISAASNSNLYNAIISELRNSHHGSYHH
jgi:hypothetical protein